MDYNSTMPASLTDTVCGLYENFAIISALVLLVISCVTHELMIFLYSTVSQFFVLTIMIVREYIGIIDSTGLCSMPTSSVSTTTVANWPSLEQAQLGTLLGFVIFYSGYWKCWNSFWLTKAVAAVGILATFIGLILLHVTEFFGALVGFLAGFLFMMIFVGVVRHTLAARMEMLEFRRLLTFTGCTDTLICPKQQRLHTSDHLHDFVPLVMLPSTRGTFDL
jgi:hypothetical protein